MVHGKQKRRFRTRYFIHKGLQLRFLGSILAIMIIIMAVVSSTLYFSVFKIMKDHLASVYPTVELLAIVNMANRVLLRNVLILIPLVAAAAIFLSHKIAGPAYRIRKTIDQITKGDLDRPITLRKNDEFKEVAEALNEMMSNLKERLGKDRKIVEDIKKSLNDLLGSFVPEEASEDFQKIASTLKEKLQEIESVLSGEKKIRT